MIPGSPPKRRCHSPYPITTTGGAPGRSSSSRRGRPRIGGTRASRNPDAVMRAARTNAPPPPGMHSVRSSPTNAERSRTDSSPPRRARRSWSDSRAGLPGFLASAYWSETTHSPASNGRLASNSAWMKPNPLAPMAMATEMPMTDTSDNPGYFPSIRTPELHVEPGEGDLVEDMETPRGSRVRSVTFDVAELEARLPGCLLRRQAAPNQVRGPQLQMVAEFLRYLGLDVVATALAAPERTEPREQTMHVISPVEWRAAPSRWPRPGGSSSPPHRPNASAPPRSVGSTSPVGCSRSLPTRSR